MKATEVVEALRVKFPPQEFAFLTEVANGTGSNARRHLDVVVAGLWPSRGLDRYGFEVKVSKGDLKRELAAPEKADALAKYLDYFSIAAPKDLVNPADLPSTWGLIEVGPRGCSWRKQATKLEPTENSRPFFAALCRAAARELDAFRQAAIPRAEFDRMVREDLEKRVTDRLDALVETKVRAQSYDAQRTVNRLKQLEDGLAAFAKIVGVSPQQLVNQSTWQWDDMAKTFLIAHRLCSHRIDLDSVANGLRSALDHVEAVACQFKADALSAAELRS